MNLLLKNATILENQNPFHNQQVDIEITNGIISKIGKNLTVKEGYEVIEKEDLHVSQGWLDTSVVFGEPGFETTETGGLDGAPFGGGNYTVETSVVGNNTSKVLKSSN